MFIFSPDSSGILCFFATKKNKDIADSGTLLPEKPILSASKKSNSILIECMFTP
jgi:hypothetical protein